MKLLIKNEIAISFRLGSVLYRKVKGIKIYFRVREISYPKNGYTLFCGSVIKPSHKKSKI